MRSILVIAGPSAVGKTSIAELMVNSGAGYELIRSVTTRAPRGNERDGEYIYVSREEFLKIKASGGFVEDMEYGKELYGTPYGEIERIFSNGDTPLLILDIQGVNSLRKREFDFSVYSVYVYEDVNVIEKRLYERELGGEISIEGFESFMKRKTANIKDYLSLSENYSLFDAFVRNENLLEILADSGVLDSWILNLGNTVGSHIELVFSAFGQCVQHLLATRKKIMLIA